MKAIRCYKCARANVSTPYHVSVAAVKACALAVAAPIVAPPVEDHTDYARMERHEIGMADFWTRQQEYRDADTCKHGTHLGSNGGICGACEHDE